MELYSSNQTYKLFHWNMLDMSEVIESWTIDSIVTDPPYELNFMGKGWDNSWIAFQPDTWKKCLDVLKPWGYLLAFWWSRTYHRIACAIEDAGFEIRDCIMWLYGSWFPKSMALDKSIEWKLTTWSANKTEFKNLDWTKEESWNWGISKMSKEQWFRNTDYTEDNHLRTVEVKHTTELAKQYKGWWTCLKPSYEPIIVARKPLEWSCTDNVIKYGVGGINIDECRVETDENLNWWAYSKWEYDTSDNVYKLWLKRIEWQYEQPQGRFPANTILTYDESDFEEVCGGFHNNEQRYYYTAKASKRDRDEWLDEFEEKKWIRSNAPRNNEEVKTKPRKNVHPTVKPTDLMQYLVRLVTPNGWTVLDPFNWSGSTGKAVMYENKDRNKNYKYIWIELTEEYLPIAKARIEYVINQEKEKSEQPKEQHLFSNYS